MSAAAWELEALKLRRSTVARTAAVVLVVGTTAMAAGFTAVALRGGESQMAVKVRPMLLGSGWEAYLGLLAQVLSVATLCCVGVVLTWAVGRELTDGTIACLQALPTSPGEIVRSKLAATMVGAGACGVLCVALAVPFGVLIGLGPPGGHAVGAALRVLAVVLLTALLTLPLAFVASIGHGYLPGIGAMLGVVVTTQIATVAGAGAWFPWAAPSLWAGMGGQAAAAAVTPVQLLLAVPVGAVGAAGTVWWWSRAELR